MSELRGPIFIVGSLRSGASLLALSLGQHPQLSQTLESSWLEEFIAGLLRGYRAASETRATSQVDVDGIELEAFLSHFGPSAHKLVTSTAAPDTLVIDSTPASVFLITPLRLLFPNARFIHVVRDLPGVVATLTDPELRLVYKSRHILTTQESAMSHWVRAINAGVGAERAFGSDVVLRVQRLSLIADPEATIRRCLEFLGVQLDAACLRPFSSITPDTIRSASGFRSAETPALLAASELSREVTQVDPRFSGDTILVDQLMSEVWQRAMRGKPLVPPIPGSRAALNLERSRNRRRRESRASSNGSAASAFSRLAQMMLGARANPKSSGKS